MRNAIKFLAVLFTLAGITWGIIFWVRYPKSPDPAKDDLKVSIEFMANPDFNRLTESHRRKYVAAVIERHKDMSFDELVRRALDRSQIETRKAMIKNVRQLPGHEKLGSRLVEIFLDKFYALSEDERTQYLSMIALAENSRMAERAKQHGLPDPTRMQTEMTRFMSNNSPQIQAKMGQFMLDMKRVRKMWGLKDPV